MTRSRTSTRLLSRAAVTTALVLGGLAGTTTAASAAGSCVSSWLDKGWTTSTVRVVNTCDHSVRVQILMSAPRLGGYPCVTVGPDSSWSYKFLKAYHIYWGTQFC